MVPPTRRTTTRNIPLDIAASVPLPRDADEPTLQSREPSEDPTPNLAEAITLMTRELTRRANDSSGSSAKAKKPDTFDGTDPRKLNNFILLCNLYFRNNSAYSDDTSKVTFALSYLRGIALEFFEPALIDSDNTPDWLEDWSIFLHVLRNQFGPIDPTADAEDNIDHLKMRDNQRIIKYNVEFNRLAIQTGWDDGVLRHRYYSGLAERIKDIMGQQGKPSTLDEMKKLAHSIDARHWERLREKSRSDKPIPTKSDKPSHNNSAFHNTSNNSTKKTHSSTNDSHKSNKPSTVNNSSKSAISDKLKDGKLTQQERQRRMDNNLCMYCGSVGHKASDCPKSTSSASKAKGRAAQVKSKDKVTSAPASGKD